MPTQETSAITASILDTGSIPVASTQRESILKEFAHVLAYFQKPSEPMGCHLPRWMKEMILLESYGADRIIWLDCGGIEMQFNPPEHYYSRQTIYGEYGAPRP